MKSVLRYGDGFRCGTAGVRCRAGRLWRSPLHSTFRMRRFGVVSARRPPSPSPLLNILCHFVVIHSLRRSALQRPPHHPLGHRVAVPPSPRHPSRNLRFAGVRCSSLASRPGVTHFLGETCVLCNRLRLDLSGGGGFQGIRNLSDLGHLSILGRFLGVGSEAEVKVKGFGGGAIMLSSAVHFLV